MKKRIVTIQLEGDQVHNVIDMLDRYGFNANDINDKLEEAFNMYLWGQHSGGGDDFFAAQSIHYTIMEVKKMVRAIAEVAKDITIKEI